MDEGGGVEEFDCDGHGDVDVRIEVKEMPGEEGDGGAGALAGGGENVAEQVIEPGEIVLADGAEAAFHLCHVQFYQVEKGRGSGRCRVSHGYAAGSERACLRRRFAFGARAEIGHLTREHLFLIEFAKEGLGLGELRAGLWRRCCPPRVLHAAFKSKHLMETL